MKIRSGFVSNSSSSSYVLIVPKEAYEEVYAASDPYTQEIIDYIHEDECLVLGQPCHILSWFSGNRNTFEDWQPEAECPEAYGEDGIHLAREIFETRVQAYEGTWLHCS